MIDLTDFTAQTVLAVLLAGAVGVDLAATRKRGVCKTMRDCIDIRAPYIPPAAMTALGRKMPGVALYHGVWFGWVLVGVVGTAGDNGHYEWFIWDDSAHTLRRSADGYSTACQALCYVLVEVGALSLPSALSIECVEGIARAVVRTEEEGTI